MALETAPVVEREIKENRDVEGPSWLVEPVSMLSKIGELDPPRELRSMQEEKTGDKVTKAMMLSY